MQRSRKLTLAFLAVILVPLGFLLLASPNKWRAARQLTIAQQALNDRELEKALSAAREAARLDPLNGKSYLTMARAFRRQAKKDKLRIALEQAAKLGVPNDRIRREQWLALAQTGQLEEAVPHLSELLANPGDDGPDICEAYANGFSLMYRLGEAFAILDAWEKDYPQDAQPHVIRAAFSSQKQNWTVSAKSLRQALKLAPNRTDVRIELAKTLLIMQESDEAANLFEQLLKTQPDHPEVLVGWAQILLERGQHAEARSTLDRVLRSDPKHVVALRLLGDIHLLSGQVNEAIRILEEAVAIKSHDRKARYALATALQKAGRDVEARQHFQFIAKNTEANQRMEPLLAKVGMNTEDANSRFQIAELLRDSGDERERLSWLRSVVALDPKHKPAHAELAKCYAALGDLEESRKHSRLAETQ